MNAAIITMGVSSFTLEQVFRLMGRPDLAAGNPSNGMVGWLMQSIDSTGQQDVIVGFDVESGVVRTFWSNSVVPECSPARHMIAFGKSEMKKASKPAAPPTAQAGGKSRVTIN